ncbi:MAG: hydrogenase maturation nickel metallochaperone HypA [Clostridiales Family XIII bacterium]|jgi:hydrogenase nickel incorporation protein HypA/HybF|nr:hydrogenase maturation nickel metallochaperone HypA [Clostridiales Family XIII bacterium]
MHEFPAAARILEIALEKAQENGADRATEIHLVMGDRCGYLFESLKLCFEAAAMGTACEKTELTVERIPAQLQCDRCGTRFVKKPFSFDCPKEGCGGSGIPTDTGREFYVKYIELSNDGSK